MQASTLSQLKHNTHKTPPLVHSLPRIACSLHSLVHCSFALQIMINAMWIARSRAIGRAAAAVSLQRRLLPLASTFAAAARSSSFTLARSTFHPSTQPRPFSSAASDSNHPLAPHPPSPPAAFDVAIEDDDEAQAATATDCAVLADAPQPAAAYPDCHEGVDWERTSVWRFDGKAHQMRCLLDPCPHPSRMFRSLYTLRNHMRRQHQRNVTSAQAQRVQAEANEGIARRGVDYGPSRDASLRNSSGTRVLECFVPGCSHPTRLFLQSVNLRTHLWKAHQLVLPKLKLK